MDNDRPVLPYTDDELGILERMIAGDKIHDIRDFMLVVERLILTARIARANQIHSPAWGEATEALRQIARDTREITALLRATRVETDDLVDPTPSPVDKPTRELIRGLTFLNEVANFEQRTEMLNRVHKVGDSAGWPLRPYYTKGGVTVP